MTLRQHDALNYVEDPFKATPLPRQAPAREETVPVGDTTLWYWDTGGDGEAVVLMHPASGSGLIWGYQQPSFAAAGLRVIGYSRRGHCKSAPIDPRTPGTAVADLDGLVDRLKLQKFHLVGTAAGGGVAADYAMDHPERLLSLTVSGNALGQRKGRIIEAAKRARPEAWDSLPDWYRELSPGYISANPEGMKAWIDLNKIAVLDHGHRQNMRTDTDPSSLKKFRMPVLLLTGASDVWTPPSIVRTIAKEIPHIEWMVASEAGHSLYWERPDLFNKVVLDFISRR